MKLISLSLIILQLSVSTIARADKLAACDAALTACDKALEAKNKEINLARIGLMQQKEVITNLEIDVQRKNDQLNAWYRNPFLLVTLGILGGVLVTGVK